MVGSAPRSTAKDTDSLKKVGDNPIIHPEHCMGFAREQDLDRALGGAAVSGDSHSLTTPPGSPRAHSRPTGSVAGTQFAAPGLLHRRACARGCFVPPDT